MSKFKPKKTFFKKLKKSIVDVIFYGLGLGLEKSLRSRSLSRTSRSRLQPWLWKCKKVPQTCRFAVAEQGVSIWCQALLIADPNDGCVDFAQIERSVSKANLILYYSPSTQLCLASATKMS